MNSNEVFPFSFASTGRNYNRRMIRVEKRINFVNKEGMYKL